MCLTDLYEVSPDTIDVLHDPAICERNTIRTYPHSRTIFAVQVHKFIRELPSQDHAHSIQVRDLCQPWSWYRSQARLEDRRDDMDDEQQGC